MRREWIKKIGVPRWEADVWQEIIRAMDGGKPDQVQYEILKGFDAPAASRYAATTPILLKWFHGYNGGKSNLKPYVDQVKPFNFLLSLQVKSRPEMARSDMNALRDPLWYRREPRPAAPYSDGATQVIENVFDRDKPEFTHIPTSWLKTYARSLARYHLHPEAKFYGGDYDERGILHRRHIHALAFQAIGKEADNIEEREFIGDDEDDVVEYALVRNDQSRLAQFVKETQRQFKISNRVLSQRAHVSHHTIDAMHTGKRLSDTSLRSLARATEDIRQGRIASEKTGIDWIVLLTQKKMEMGSDAALGKYLGVSPSQVTRMRRRERQITDRVKKKLRL